MAARLLPVAMSLLLIAGLMLGACQPMTLPTTPTAASTPVTPPATLAPASTPMTLPATPAAASAPEPLSAPTSHSSVVEGEFTSDALAGNLLGDPVTRKFAVYLPPSYATGEQAYPVVYALHGFTGNQWAMSDFVQVLDRMIRAGDVPEMIVVMPDASNAYGGSFYMNSPTIGDYETYVSQELVSWVDGHYHTIAQPESRGITGCSMGGLGAVRLGLKFPQVYGVIAGVSGPYLQAYHGLLKMALDQIEAIPQTPADFADQPFPVQAAMAIAAAAAPNPDKAPFYLDMPFVEVDGGFKYVDDVYRRMGAVYANAALENDLAQETRRQSVMLYHGNQDPLALVEGARAFSAMLNDRGIAHEYLEVDGGHCTLDYEPVVRFLAQQLVFKPMD